MALIELGAFCREYRNHHRCEYQRIYNSLLQAIQGSKVKGERKDGRWLVNAHQAEKWLAGRGHKSATPPPSYFKPQFHMEPGDPYLPLFVDEHGQPLDPENPMASG